MQWEAPAQPPFALHPPRQQSSLSLYPIKKLAAQGDPHKFNPVTLLSCLQRPHIASTLLLLLHLLKHSTTLTELPVGCTQPLQRSKQVKKRSKIDCAPEPAIVINSLQLELTTPVTKSPYSTNLPGGLERFWGVESGREANRP